MKKYTISLLIVFCLIACKDKDTEFKNILIPEFDITLGYLEDNHFENVPETDIIMEKQFGDTLLYYIIPQDGYGDSDSKPCYRYCEFPVKSLNLDTLERFFTAHYCFLIAKAEESESFINFYVKTSNNLYLCCFVKKSDSTMNVGFSYPQLPQYLNGSYKRGKEEIE